MDISLKDLIETGAHFGHQARRWNPKMQPFIYKVQDGVHIFDLPKTKKMLLEAIDEIQKTVREGKSIVFVGTKKQCKDKVREVAEKSGCFYVNERWLGGTLTNFGQIKKSLLKHIHHFACLNSKLHLKYHLEIAKIEVYQYQYSFLPCTLYLHQIGLFPLTHFINFFNKLIC